MKASRYLPAAAILIATSLGVWQWLKVRPEAAGAGRSVAPATHQAAAPAVPDTASRRTSSPTSPASHPLAATPGSLAADPASPAPAPEPTPQAPVVRRRFAPAPSAARLPLVFAMPPEEMTGLNERQAAAAIAIADQFYSTIGGDTADPSTTDYKDRWKREQPLADYQLRAAIGAQAYARWQEEAYLRQRAAAR